MVILGCGQRGLACLIAAREVGARRIVITGLAADGLVVLDRDEIRVTPLGRIFIRNAAMVFDSHLEAQKTDQKPLFSKTL